MSTSPLEILREAGEAMREDADSRWHAVATLMDETADHLDVDHWAPGVVICGAALEGLDCSILECAPAVASAYLGRQR